MIVEDEASGDGPLLGSEDGGPTPGPRVLCWILRDDQLPRESDDMRHKKRKYPHLIPYPLSLIVEKRNQNHKEMFFSSQIALVDTLKHWSQRLCLTEEEIIDPVSSSCPVGVAEVRPVG